MSGNLKLLPQAERQLSGKLNAQIADDDTTANVNTPPSASKLPTYLEFDYGTDDSEVVRVIDVSGNTITIERGVNSGGVGKVHLVNANYKQKMEPYYNDEITLALEQGWLKEDSSYAFARVSTSSFKITAASVDRSAYYTAGRVVRLNGSVVVNVLSSSYSNPDTTVTVAETTVPATITQVEMGIAPRGATREIATGAEINTGTDNVKAASPKAIADSNLAFLADIPVKATGAEVNTGTDDVKFATAKAIADSNIAFLADLLNTPNIKVGTTSYDTSTTGSLAITNVGFTPRLVILLGSMEASGSTSVFTIGYAAASGSFWLGQDHAGVMRFDTTTGFIGILCQSGIATSATLALASFDADGFTLTKAKNGSPSGTGRLFYLAIG